MWVELLGGQVLRVPTWVSGSSTRLRASTSEFRGLRRSRIPRGRSKELPRVGPLSLLGVRLGGSSAEPASGRTSQGRRPGGPFRLREGGGGGSLQSARGGNSVVVARSCSRIQGLDALVSQRGYRPRLYRIRVGGGYGCEVCRCEPKLRNQQPTATLVARLTWSWCHLWREPGVNMNKTCFPWLSPRGRHVGSAQVLVEGCSEVRRR